MRRELSATGTSAVSDLTLPVAAVEILLLMLILWLAVTLLLLGQRRRRVVLGRGRQYQ